MKGHSKHVEQQGQTYSVTEVSGMFKECVAQCDWYREGLRWDEAGKGARFQRSLNALIKIWRLSSKQKRTKQLSFDFCLSRFKHNLICFFQRNLTAVKWIAFGGKRRDSGRQTRLDHCGNPHKKQEGSQRRHLREWKSMSFQVRSQRLQTNGIKGLKRKEESRVKFRFLNQITV